MALTEQKIVKQIAFLPESDAVNVQWANQVLRDGQVVLETYHRKAYLRAQRDQFLVDVDGAEPYATAIGW